MRCITVSQYEERETREKTSSKKEKRRSSNYLLGGVFSLCSSYFPMDPGKKEAMVWCDLHRSKPSPPIRRAHRPRSWRRGRTPCGPGRVPCPVRHRSGVANAERLRSGRPTGSHHSALEASNRKKCPVQSVCCVCFFPDGPGSLAQVMHLDMC